MYKCGWNGCEKAYGTLNHLNAHVTMQSHGAKRTPEGKLIDFVAWFYFGVLFWRCSVAKSQKGLAWPLHTSPVTQHSGKLGMHGARSSARRRGSLTRLNINDHPSPTLTLFISSRHTLLSLNMMENDVLLTTCFFLPFSAS